AHSSTSGDRLDTDRAWPCATGGGQAAPQSVLLAVTNGTTRLGPIALRVIGAGLAGRRDILRAGALEDVLGLLHPFGFVAMHGKQNPAFLNPAFVALGFVLRNSKSDKGANKTADSAAGAKSREHPHDGTGRNERAQAGDSQRADAGEPAQRSTDYRARTGSSSRALGSLGALLMGEILGSHIVRQQHRDVRVTETVHLQCVHCVLDRHSVGIDS